MGSTIIRTLAAAGVLVLGACGGGGGGSGSTSAPQPPAIAQAPAAVAVVEGEVATFSATATGTPPLSYQWLRDGQPIAGADQPALSVPTRSLRADDGAQISVRVSNAAGTVTSAATRLTVTLKPKLAVCAAASFVLRADGTVWGWGSNAAGLLGRGADPGTLTSSAAPAAAQGVSDIVDLACGADHVVALRRDGSLQSWGANANGQLGTGDRGDRSTATPVAGLIDVVQVVAGGQASFALSRDGSVHAWGTMNFVLAGQDPQAVLAPQPVSMPAPVVKLAASFGVGHDVTAFAVTSAGRLLSWSPSAGPRLGRVAATAAGAQAPGEVASLDRVVAVAGGQGVVIAVRDDGSVWAWGSNVDGALGDGTRQGERTTPAQVAGVSTAANAATGMHALVLSRNGTLTAWGGNQYGQVGNNTDGNVITAPVAVSQFVLLGPSAPPGPVQAIAANSVNSLAYTADGRVFAWGYNASGQLGTTAPAYALRAMQPLEVAGITVR